MLQTSFNTLTGIYPFETLSLFHAHTIELKIRFASAFAKKTKKSYTQVQ